MKVAHVVDDKVQLQGSKFGLLQDAWGVVTREYGSDFRVKVGEIEIVIADPEKDLQAQPVDVASVVSMITGLVGVLPNRAVPKIKKNGLEVELPPRDFLRTFNTFGRDSVSSGGAYLSTEVSGVTFTAYADSLIMADYDLDKATEQTAVEEVGSTEHLAEAAASTSS